MDGEKTVVDANTTLLTVADLADAGYNCVVVVDEDTWGSLGIAPEPVAAPMSEEVGCRCLLFVFRVRNASSHECAFRRRLTRCMSWQRL